MPFESAIRRIDVRFTELRTNPSGEWWKALVIGLYVGVAPIFLMGLLPVEGVLFATIRFLLLVAMVAAALLVMLSLYVDAQYLEHENADWQPNIGLYLFAVLLFPIVGYISVVVYLYRRHRTVGVP